ncbi:hypothetical protein BMW23_0315 [Bodo saltans virus]|uniref:Uncharacterized protein n=1 Tax=Bodo saltans virus TaxID=2024608 RepID=A0A2H4UTV2_9VIRU|nr:hypothetical protein QJ851_gp0310 [Bodo saltans virus]ATZ80373.1 hypothetical protein BMW23_0315 [Bodo saltans virus]
MYSSYHTSGSFAVDHRVNETKKQAAHLFAASQRSISYINHRNSFNTDYDFGRRYDCNNQMQRTKDAMVSSMHSMCPVR